MPTPRVRHGFVLLEAVVALLVIGLAAAAGLELFAAQARAAAREQELVTAAALAQDRLAALRLVDAGELRRLPDSLAGGRFAPPFAIYRWRAESRRSPADTTLYDLRVEVHSNEGSFALATSRGATPRQGAP